MGTGSGKRRPFQHAGEVTRKKKQATAEATDEEPPAFTRSKIGGAKNLIGKPFEVADATDTDARTNRDFRTVGGIRAEHASITDRANLSKNYSVHLLETLPGWRRHWGALTKYHAWAWTDLSDMFISRVCKSCFESGTRCVSESRATMPGEKDYSYVCKDCRSSSSCCYWLIAYQSHPQEDTDIDSIPDYRARLLARQNQAAIGTPLEVSGSAAIVEKEFKVPIKVESSNVKTPTPPPLQKPTYSKVRSAYEDLAAMEYDDQCKRKGQEKPIDWDATPAFWEAEASMGRARGFMTRVDRSVIQGQSHFYGTNTNHLPL